MSVDAGMITNWRSQYSLKYRVPQDVLASFGDDVAHAMKGLVASGKSPGEAYRIITNGLYAEQRAIAANGRRRRTSRRLSKKSKRTSRKRSSR